LTGTQGSDFYIPIPLDTNNITALSPFLVPQEHLGTSILFNSLAFFTFFLFVAGTIINSLTIVCTIQYKKLRSHLNYILVNLAVSNLLVSTFGSFLAFYAFWNKYFVWGPMTCKLEGFASTLGGMVSLWSLAVIAVERYLVICKPISNFTFKNTHALIGLPPFHRSPLWKELLLLPHHPHTLTQYIPEGLQCSCGPDWYTVKNKYNNESYVMFLFCFCFGIPLFIIVFSYSQLLFTLKSAARAQEQSASTQKAEREVTKMVVVMVLGFLVCWMPYTLFSLWVVTHRNESFDLRFATIPSCFSKSSTVYNPVIYVLMNKQFRSCMMKLIFCGKSPFGDDEEGSSSQVTQVSSVSSSQVSPS
uniref:Opsin 1 (cone pigments), short-wave-sensitive 2 n=1 Tax=Scleropages formosus TaxID=113540 RepID=A0A8C9T6V0_SCLFO